MNRIKFWGLAVLMAAVLAVMAGVGMADSLPDSARVAKGTEVFIIEFPDVVSDQKTAEVLFADDWEDFQLAVMADCWLEMGENAKKVSNQLAAETQATWKSHPGGTKYDVMLQLLYSLNRGQPVNDQAVTVSGDLRKNFVALSEDDKALLLSSYIAASELVRGNT
ncbi:MAG: hypothetical protein N3A57_03495 [Negativicutes bacterium]|nr:hypothetical protein [Negativicutes bacterium]